MALTAGERSYVTQEPASEVSARLRSAVGIICGTSKIKEALSSGSQNIPWPEIIRTADGYLAKQDFELASLLETIKVDQVNLERALQAEAVADFSSDSSKLTQLMQPVFAVFEDEAMMRESMCGARRVGKRRFSNVYEPAIMSFQMSVTSALKEEIFTMNDGDRTAQNCLSILGLENAEDRDADACKSMCAEIASQARNLTSLLALRGRGTQTSKDIEAELEKLQSAVRSVKALISDCSNAKEELTKFKDQMEALDKQLVDQRSVYAGASAKLREATFDLEDLEEQAQEHAKILAELLDIAEAAKLFESTVVGELRKVEEQASQIQDYVTQHTVRLKEVGDDIAAAQEASSITRDFRSKLANLMLQMLLSFDGAVRTPLELLGLGRGVNVLAHFPENAVKAVKSTTLFALRDMLEFCERNATKEAFDKAQDAVMRTEPESNVNFGELCQVYDVDAVAASFEQIVQQRVDGVVKLLESAQSWMYDFKGQVQADESKDSNDGVGEPEGLRKVISIYNESPFYKGYLKKWKIGGTFHKYYAALALALRKSQETQQQLMDELYGFQVKLQSLMMQIKDTNVKLAAALAASKEAGMNVEAAEQVAAQMELSRQAMEQTVAQLKENSATASQGVDQARQNLEQTYLEAAAFLQILQEHEPEVIQIARHGSY